MEDVSIRRALKLWGPPLAVAIVIFLLSSIPGTELRLQLFAHADKLAHACEFGLLGFLLLRALSGCTSWSLLVATAVTLGLVLLYGALDELHQLHVPHRDVDGWDLVADFGGGLAGCGVWYGLRQLTRRDA